MRDGIATKEDQIPLLHLLPCNTVRKCIVLLIGVTRDDIPSHAITELDQSTAINACPTSATPEIASVDEGACIQDDSTDGHTGIWLATMPYAHCCTIYPGCVCSG